MNKVHSSAISVVLVALSGCAENDEFTDIQANVETIESPLFLEGATWPNGQIPVCWSAASVARSDFDVRSAQVRSIVNSTWSSVADIEFTGWGTCPASTSGMVTIALNDSTDANSNVGYKGTSGYHYVNLGVSRFDFTRGLIPHEFGHQLGFAHEMRRNDFADDSTGSCSEANATGDYLGTPADRDSIMASTGYCQDNPLLSRWDMVGARNAYGYRSDAVLTVGSSLYARKGSAGIYKKTGSSWTFVGGNGTEFVSVGSNLYGLSYDGSAVSVYSGSGTSWSVIGGAAASILKCGAFLCATNSVNGDLYRYNGSIWSKIGERASQYASSSTSIYRLNVNRSAVEVYSGSGDTWTTIGGPSSGIYATSSAVFSASPANDAIFKYTGSTWTLVGGGGRTYVAVGSTLYGLSPNRGSVYQYSGTGSSWSLIGGAASWLYGGTNLYAINPAKDTIFRYNGSSWVNEGMP